MSKESSEILEDLNLCRYWRALVNGVEFVFPPTAVGRMIDILPRLPTLERILVASLFALMDCARVSAQEPVDRKIVFPSASVPIRHDTATFISLGPPPVNDSAALAAWLRVGQSLFGATNVQIGARESPMSAAAQRLGLDLGNPNVKAALSSTIASTRVIAARPDLPAKSRRFKKPATAVVVSVPNIPANALQQSQPRPLSEAEEAAARADLERAGVSEKSKFVRATFGERPILLADYNNDGFKEGYVRDIKEAVRGAPARRRAVLAILDSGWPSDTAKTRSFAFFDALAAAARTLYGIKVPFGGAPPPAPWTTPTNDHVMYVAQAIDSLISIRNDSLTVVYFPLAVPTTDKDALRRLLLTDWLIQYQFNRLVATGDGGPCSIGDLAQREACFQASPITVAPDSLQKAVDAIVRRALAYKTTNPFDSGVQTTVDIFNAVWTLLEVWAAANHSTAYISASWTAVADSRSMPAKSRIGGTVLTIAAAGNTDSLVKKGYMEDFVQRPFDGDQFLLVENKGLGDASMCYSTHLDPNDVVDASLTLYHFGLVRDREPKSCGTSFAAPRVAWVLAYGETLRKGVCPKSADADRRRQSIAKAKQLGTSERWPIIYLNSVSGRDRIRITPGCD